MSIGTSSSGRRAAVSSCGSLMTALLAGIAGFAGSPAVAAGQVAFTPLGIPAGFVSAHVTEIEEFGDALVGYALDAQGRATAMIHRPQFKYRMMKKEADAIDTVALCTTDMFKNGFQGGYSTVIDPTSGTTVRKAGIAIGYSTMAHQPAGSEVRGLYETPSGDKRIVQNTIFKDGSTSAQFRKSGGQTVRLTSPTGGVTAVARSNHLVRNAVGNASLLVDGFGVTRATRWDIPADPTGDVVGKTLPIIKPFVNQPGAYSIASGVGPNNAETVGACGTSAANRRAVLWFASNQAIDLGAAPAAMSRASEAFDVSDTGFVIAGRTYVGEFQDSRAAFWYGADRKYYDLAEFLTKHGFNLTGWTLHSAVGAAVPDPAKPMLFVNAINPQGFHEPCIVVIPSPGVGACLAAFAGVIAVRRRRRSGVASASRAERV